MSILFLSLLILLLGPVFSTKHILFKNEFPHPFYETLDLRNQTEQGIALLQVDEFDDTLCRMWFMRILFRSDMWEPGNPFCVLMNGQERLETDSYLYTGTFYEIGQSFNCNLVLTEHRYYGYIPPISDFAPQPYRFLNSAQAMADVAVLIKGLKQNFNSTNTPTLVAGGGYAGNLAAWMREQYPDIVDVAYASSAPIMAKVNFFEYLEHVGKVLVQYGNQYCFDKVRYKFAEYERLLASSDGIRYLKKLHGICESSDLTRWENKQLFYLRLITFYQDTVKNGLPEDIQNLCFDQTQDAGVMLSDKFRGMYNNDQNCEVIDYDYYVMWTSKVYVDYWLYQTCSEFGFFPTTDSYKQPFPVNALSIEFFHKLCKDAFGIQRDVTENGVNSTNKKYGGWDFQGTNVAFVYGSMDPWRDLGYKRSDDKENLLLEIPNVSHCDDMNTRPNDSPEKQSAIELLKAWVLDKLGK